MRARGGDRFGSLLQSGGLAGSTTPVWEVRVWSRLDFPIREDFGQSGLGGDCSEKRSSISRSLPLVPADSTVFPREA
jgi:hypothetical protein